jgi:Protein of unknown function (DUF2934)
VTEQKTKPITKKVATAMTGSAIAAKQKTTKARTATTAKQPAAQKPVAKKPAAKTAATREKPATTQKRVTNPTPEERYRMVETAAYFIAEQHGFQGRSDEHWAQAEREIAAKLGK